MLVMHGLSQGSATVIDVVDANEWEVIHLKGCKEISYLMFHFENRNKFRNMSLTLVISS